MKNNKNGLGKIIITHTGLKIAPLSSKAFGGAQNNYQYQGDYSEFDPESFLSGQVMTLIGMTLY